MTMSNFNATNQGGRRMSVSSLWWRARALVTFLIAIMLFTLSNRDVANVDSNQTSMEDYDQQSRPRYRVVEWISGHDVAQSQFLDRERTVGSLSFSSRDTGGIGCPDAVSQAIFRELQLDEAHYSLNCCNDKQTECERASSVLRKPRHPSSLGVVLFLLATAGVAFGFFYGLCRLCGLIPTPGHRLREKKYRDD
jgi:hypothetical protein